MTKRKLLVSVSIIVFFIGFLLMVNSRPVNPNSSVDYVIYLDTFTGVLGFILSSIGVVGLLLHFFKRNK